MVVQVQTILLDDVKYKKKTESEKALGTPNPLVSV